MESTVKALTIDEVDLLMKYIYKGMEQQPDGQTCSSLLAWHAQVLFKIILDIHNFIKKYNFFN